MTHTVVRKFTVSIGLPANSSIQFVKTSKVINILVFVKTFEYQNIFSRFKAIFILYTHLKDQQVAPPT